MGKTRIITLVVLLSLFLGIISWDIYLAVNGIPGDTISESLLFLATKSILIPASAGYVMGHLFWPMRKRLPGWAIITVTSAIGLSWLFVDIFGRDCLLFIRSRPIIPFVVHVLAGHFIWPQIKKA